MVLTCSLVDLSCARFCMLAPFSLCTWKCGMICNCVCTRSLFRASSVFDVLLE